MARVLHLLKGVHLTLARAAIERALAAGDEVTVALLPGAPDVTLPDQVQARRVPEELSYAALLELVFAADHVLPW